MSLTTSGTVPGKWFPSGLTIWPPKWTWNQLSALSPCALMRRASVAFMRRPSTRLGIQKTGIRFHTFPHEIAQNLHPNRNWSTAELVDNRLGSVPPLLVPREVQKFVAFPCEVRRHHS